MYQICVFKGSTVSRQVLERSDFRDLAVTDKGDVGAELLEIGEVVRRDDDRAALAARENEVPRKGSELIDTVLLIQLIISVHIPDAASSGVRVGSCGKDLAHG